MDRTKSKIAILRLARFLLLIFIAPGVASLILTSLQGLYTQVTSSTFSGSFSELFLSTFFALLPFSAVYVILFFIVSLPEPLSRFKLSRYLKKHQIPKEERKSPRWAYETRNELRGIVDLIMLSILVFSFALVLFFPGDYLRWNGTWFLLFALTFVALLVHRWLRGWVEEIDGAVFFLDRFLRDLDKTPDYDLPAVFLDRLEFLESALHLFSRIYPGDFRIDVENLCFELREFVVSPTNMGNIRALVSNNIREFRERLDDYDVQGALVDLFTLRHRIGDASQKRLAVMRHEKPFLTRLWQTLRSERFWAIIYAATFLFYFFLSILGWPFGIRLA